MKVSATAPWPYAQVVVDTNVIISAALSPSGAPAELMDVLLNSSRLVFSPVTFAEFEQRLWKPKFDRYISMEARQSLLHVLNGSATWIQVSDEAAAVRFSRDRQDDAFVHVARACGATRIVSGDVDLLVLNPLSDLKLLSPRAALSEIKKLLLSNK